ncbi:MAG TPA: M56 family metallopeptidase, partial [Armatimonadota bacterium]|nr:M56 family metallopeptidase [Armatimonadota bacterium]
MIAWPSTADALAQVWAASMWRASWQGAVALAAAWALCRLLPRMPAGVRPWVWRLAYLKLLLALCWATPVDLPLLPAAPVPVTAAQGLEPAPLRGPVPVAVPPAPEAAPAAPPPKRATSHPVTVVMLLWMAGVGLCFVRLGSRWRRSRRLLAGCTAVEDPAVIAEAERLRRSLGIGRPVEVWVGPGPLLVGTLRPVIVLP